MSSPQGLADAPRVLVGIEEVHVDPGTVGVEDGEDRSRPRGLLRPDGGVLHGEPRCVYGVVLHVAADVRGGVPRDSGNRAP